MIVNKSAA